MALAVGRYDGRVHLAAVAADFKLVSRWGSPEKRQEFVEREQGG